MSINVNKAKDLIKECSLDQSKKEKTYINYIEQIHFDKFRHIKDLTVDFKSPITIITGNNRCGKTSILLAIACSHYSFKIRNQYTGLFERATWSDVMRFTQKDIQSEDWVYSIVSRTGEKKETKTGRRNFQTKKWAGVAKKESQIGTPKLDKKTGKIKELNKQVTYIDLNRIIPARDKSNAMFSKVKQVTETIPVNKEINEYISYILEENYSVDNFTENETSEIYAYKNTSSYSSYNTASGEDVLTHILNAVVNSPRDSLILIEEIEIGLHPNIQRRLLDILSYISSNEHKQFIITTHSPTVLSCVYPQSRIFIENRNGQYLVIKDISVNATFCRMDTIEFPLVNIYVEDPWAKKIVEKVLSQMNKKNPGFNNYLKPIVTGPANEIYNYYTMKKKLFAVENTKVGYAAILDGDKRNEYEEDDLLFFLYSDKSPEYFLVDCFEKQNSNPKLRYHIEQSNNHYLFKEMLNQNLCYSEDEAFELCWNCFLSTQEGNQFISELSSFLYKTYNYFSIKF